MKTVTARDLRYDFPKVERPLLQGHSVQVTRRGTVIADITPNRMERPRLPDFEARIKEIFGDKLFEVSGADLISADREERF